MRCIDNIRELTDVLTHKKQGSGIGFVPTMGYLHEGHLEELYSISDLKLLLSEKESFGLVALEAMACGVPAIGTDIGGIPEVIEDGVNGFICPLGDLEAVASKAVKALKDGALYAELSRNAEYP